MFASLKCLDSPLYPRSASTFSPSSNSQINACQNTLMSHHCPHGNSPCRQTISPVQMHKPASYQTPDLLNLNYFQPDQKGFFVYSEICSINRNQTSVANAFTFLIFPDNLKCNENGKKQGLLLYHLIQA